MPGSPVLWFKYACLTAFAMVVFYIVTFGPLLFVIESIERSTVVPHALNVPLSAMTRSRLYNPHFLAMVYVEQYYDYVNWWLELGGRSSVGTYKMFRAHSLVGHRRQQRPSEPKPGVQQPSEQPSSEQQPSEQQPGTPSPAASPDPTPRI